MSDIVIGVDAGTRKAGVAVLDCTGILLDSEQINLKAALSLNQRLAALYQTLLDIVVPWAVAAKSAGEDVVLAVERPYVGCMRHSRSALVLAQAVGVVKTAAYEAGIDPASIVEVSPAQAKKALTGDGHASKADMVQAATACFGVTQEDEAGAIGIGLAGLEALSGKSTQAHRRKTRK